LKNYLYALILALPAAAYAQATPPASSPAPMQPTVVTPTPPVASANTNPFAQPSLASFTPAPVLNPAALEPGFRDMPGMPGMPDPRGMTPPPVMVDPATRQEDITAVRIGVVNGKNIYRGTNTYLFQDAIEHPVSRTLANTSAAAPSAAEETSTGQAPRSRAVLSRTPPSRSAFPLNKSANPAVSR
jgi:hypothetical protein